MASSTGKVMLGMLVIVLVLGGLVAHRHLSSGAGNTQDAAEKKLVFVYLHGFGGEKEHSQFCKNMEEFLRGVDYPCAVSNYVWDSVDIEIMKAGANWLEAEQKADEEALSYKANVIDRLEKARIPYVLVGFSVGSRVILRALELSEGNLQMLRGVYFLGSAMTCDTTIDRKYLPKDMKIVNFHSPRRDKVHRIAFHFMEDLPAGGQDGFDDETIFENLPVSCTHAHKGVGVHIDYSQLAYSIGYLALLKEHIEVPGDTSFNLENSVGDGDTWWNKILRMDCTIDGQLCKLEIEQLNMNLDYFRAVAEFPDGERKRLARGNNVHAILNQLGVLPEGYWKVKN